MLLDDTGKELKPSLKEEDVLRRLKELAPRTPEEERILAQKIGESLEFYRREKLNMGLNGGFNDLFAENQQRRTKTDGFSDGRDWRTIAKIPREMLYVAKEVWGDDVITNDEKFKEAFVKDETGKLCLTVDPKTI